MYRRYLITATTLALVLAPPAARAENGISGPELGVRGGYAFPMGTLAAGAPLSDGVIGHFAVVLDTGYRIVPNLYVGLSFQYGIMQVRENEKTNCGQSQIDCSGRDYRVNALAIYHLLPHRSIDPWGGLGVGYELLSITPEGPGQSGTLSWHGFEFVNLMLGVDFITVVSRMYVAPVIQFSVGRFSSGHISIGATDSDSNVSNSGVHEWLTLGMRVTYIL